MNTQVLDTIQTAHNTAAQRTIQTDKGLNRSEMFSRKTQIEYFQYFRTKGNNKNSEHPCETQ